MRTSRRVLAGIAAVFLGLIVLTGHAAPEGPPDNGPVTVRDIKYDDLGQLVRAQKGKVVVVDFWGEY
jgi:hypothetical protein